MSVALEQLRDQARRHAAAAQAIDAERADTTLTIGEDRYFIRVERRYRKERAKAGRQGARTLISERVLIRERSAQGDVVFAAPLEWL